MRRHSAALAAHWWIAWRIEIRACLSPMSAVMGRIQREQHTIDLAAEKRLRF